MNEFLNQFTAPAVVVASIALILQAIFGIMNSISNKRSNRISYVVSLWQLTESLPFDSGKKSSIKLGIAEQLITEGFPEILEKAVKDEFEQRT